MAQITVSHLTFAYDGTYDNIFEDVSFQIDTDWKLGFTGRNGRGKTTFLKLLLGELEYSGTISAPVKFDYFPFPVSDKDRMTIEIVDDIHSTYEYWQLQRELSKLRVDEDVLYRPFDTLSNGEQTKVLLAVLFLKEQHFLLIDEPTNHLDMEAREIVSSYLNTKKGFLLVSHDRSFLDNCTDHTLSINKTNIDIQKGNFSSWYQNKQMQDDFERAENEKHRKEIRRLTASARQSSQWADRVESTKIGGRQKLLQKDGPSREYIGEQSRRMQMRRKNLEHRKLQEIEEKSSLLKNIETIESLKLFPERYHTDRLAVLEDVSVSYDGHPVLTDFSLTIFQGDRIALRGKNGSGKTTLLKLLLKELPDYTGQVQLGSGLKISYVPQRTDFLRGSLEDYAEDHGIDITLLKSILRKLDFDRVQFEKPMETYSEGQKKKVLLAGSLCEKAHLYIWDEPLNFIDIFSRMQMEELLLTFQPTLLFVEHDRIFSDTIATRIVEL